MIEEKIMAKREVTAEMNVGMTVNSAKSQIKGFDVEEIELSFPIDNGWHVRVLSVCLDEEPIAELRLGSWIQNPNNKLADLLFFDVTQQDAQDFIERNADFWERVKKSWNWDLALLIEDQNSQDGWDYLFE